MPAPLKASRFMPGRRSVRGQVTVEWVLLVALVVVAVFGLMFLFRHQIIALATAAWLQILEWTE